MMGRPQLSVNMNVNEFKDYYYLKEELMAFCRSNGLSSFGSKADLTERIVCFINKEETPSLIIKKRNIVDTIDEETIIEQNIVCSEKHRAFFKEKIGESFSFNVLFQKWLKENSGKKYKDAINAYYPLKKAKKEIEKQFEYNTYIRDFFKDNKGKSLEEAIKCWNYKKKLKGQNCYEKEDLCVLE